MKKILSLVLAAMMIFSVLPAAFAAETAVAAEVSEDVVEAITLLNDLGIYKGYENGDMGADDLVQRYQMSIFATRFKSGRVDDKIWATTENDSGFTDVVDFAGASDYVLGMISYAAQAGIVNGTGDNKFEPNLYVKYKEAITMVVRALGQVYSAASYPWAYIQFANDNGLLAGIDTDIAPDDFVSRGVIAQLLYNALFAEINGATVAEKNFGIGYTTVMVTASNNVVYEPNASAVLSNGKIRFAEIDVQGEPVGADYHVDAALFGLDAAAADAAVGTLFNVYYKNSFADILSAESLAVVYENRGWDNMEVKASSSKTYLSDKDYDALVTFDGTTYKVVSEYTDLNRKQGPASTAAGTPEMKVFLETGADVALSVMKPGYKLSADGMYIYDMTLTSGTGFFTPVAFYSEALDLWYTQDNGTWKVVDPSTFFVELSSDINVGFGQQDDASAVSAYADITVSANERMTVREYRLGYIEYDTQDIKDMYNSTTSKAPTFMIKRYLGNTTGITTADDVTTMEWEDTAYNLYSYNGTATNGNRPVGTSGSENEYVVSEYRWTGLQKAQVPEYSYVLYYINHETLELDVLEVISGDAADGTGTVKGYIRGFDLASNTLTFGANYDVYTFDYDALAGATIKSLATNKGADSTNGPSYNFWYLDDLYDKYVTLVIVDGKVVHIEANNAESEFVIIDKFVSFEEDGVIADAWSTVTNSYTQIKIASYDGWSVGGFDYWMYFLGTIPGVNLNTMQLPFTTYTLYRVVSQANGVYDLTNAGVEADYTDATTPTPKSLTQADLKVNQYGYIEGVESNGKLGSTNIVAAAASHYWMILDKSDAENPVVYSLNGIINPVDFARSADYFKVKGDFVIVINKDTDWTMSNNFFGNDVKFYKYNKIVNYYDNQNYLNQLNPYNYSLYMTNVVTGEVDSVQLGNDAINLGGLTNGYYANEMYSKLEEGAIYMAVDGVISDVTDENKWDLDEIAAYYTRYIPGYDRSVETHNQTNGITGHNLNGITKFADAMNLVTKYMDSMIYPGMVVNSNIHDKNVTVICEKPTAGQEIITCLASASTSSGNGKTINGYLGNADYDYHMYFVVNDETKTAIVWLDYVGSAVTTKTATLTTNSLSSDPTVSLSYVPAEDELTFTVAIPAPYIKWDAAKDVVRVRIYGLHNSGVELAASDLTVNADGYLTAITFTAEVDATTYEAINQWDLTIARDGKAELYVNGTLA